MSKESQSKEYKLGYEIAHQLRDNTNFCLGDLLTIVESALGDTVQAQSTKKLVKHYMWKLADENQRVVYRTLKVEADLPIGSNAMPALKQ